MQTNATPSAINVVEIFIRYTPVVNLQTRSQIFGKLLDTG